MNTLNRDRGAVLLMVLVMAIVVGGFCVVSLLVSGTESRGANRAILRDRALFVAQSGLEDQFKTLNDMKQSASPLSPFLAFDALKGTLPIQRRPLVSDGLTIGEYTVAIDCVTALDPFSRDITVSATGWVPSASDPQAVEHTVTAVVRLTVGRSQVFDYVYFINNWGWYYGATIYANGNIRANGQFDFGGYAATVNGIPRFESVAADGSVGAKIDDGGIYAGWNVINYNGVKGQTNGKGSMHSYDEQIPMPNLTDLTLYESAGKTANSNIKIGGVVMCNSVAGDETGELSNLYLEGTATNPIELNGTVVVRGNLIIKGYVKGKGSLYVKGNIYVAGNIIYSNPPQNVPSSLDQHKLQEYLRRKEQTEADALGLFAREHIVVSDYTDPTWQWYVSQWVYDKRNGSEEDAGEDGIPNTRAGKDGIRNTADDDVLEDDHTWTVDHYKAGDKLPAGANVGDAIPGSGEDIDGDGTYDPTVSMSEFNIPVALKKDNWAGNFPSVLPVTYRSLCASGHNISRIDAAFYTNHSFAMLTLTPGDMNFNGCVVSRNESIVYGAKKLNFNYDPRLLMESGPHGLDLPRTWQPMRMVMWTSN